MKQKPIFLSAILILLFAAACGTVADPVPSSLELTEIAEHDAEEAEAEVAEVEDEENGEEVAVVATSTPTELPPTPTDVPPTATEAPPTETPTLIPPTATPTEEPAGANLTDEQQAIVDAVMVADVSNGETLFNVLNDTGFACSTCHNVNSLDRLIGPGLLGIPERAETRVEGEPAIIYLWNSIIMPNAYIVEGDPVYPEGLMPQNYLEIYTEGEIHDIVAYLMTLEE